jgi:hypothetical protein
VAVVRGWSIYPHSMSRAWGEFLLPTCIIGMFSILNTFLAGLVIRGTQRIALVSGGIRGRPDVHIPVWFPISGTRTFCAALRSLRLLLPIRNKSFWLGVTVRFSARIEVRSR